MPKQDEIWAIHIHGKLYPIIALQDAWNLVSELAKVYTLSTDQIDLIRLVEKAKKLTNKEIK